VIFVTVRDTAEDELRSILAGGADFITKPYDTMILLEKIKRAIHLSDPQTFREISKNGYTLDMHLSLLKKDGKEIELTRNEFRILYYFFMNDDRVIGREEILEKLWNDKYYLEEKIVWIFFQTVFILLTVCMLGMWGVPAYHIVLAAVLSALFALLFLSVQYFFAKKKYNKMPWSLVEEYLPQKDVFNYKDMNKYIFIFSQNWNWNKIFKKEFIDKNHISFQSLYRTNDLFFTCKALICADKISVVNEELVVYRTGMKTNSQSTNHLHPLDFYEAFKTLREYLISIDKFEDVEQCYINWALKGLINNVISVKDKTVKYKMGNFLYNSGLEYLGLCSVDFRDIYLQSDYEEFIDQFYKYRKKMFGYEKSKNHYFIYLFGLRLVVKRRFLCQK